MKGIFTLVLGIWMVGCTWFYVCKVKGFCNWGSSTYATTTTNTNTTNNAIKNTKPEPVKTAVNDATASNNKANNANAANNNANAAANKNAGADKVFVIKDGNFSAQSNTWAMFDKSGAKANTPPQLKNALRQVGQHLKTNPDKQLTITGAYTKDEKNSSWYDNLGIARAENIKSAILGSGVSGIDGDNIVTKGQLNNNLVFENNKTNGNIRTAFSKSNKADKKAALTKRTADVEKTLKAAPKNFYFDSGSSVIELDTEMRNYFRDLKFYLGQKPTAKITLTGHTDSDGQAAGNLSIGQKRANRIKNYMQQNGIKISQIQTDSKGETSPIATNDTDAGKAKNRRVEIRVN